MKGEMKMMKFFAVLMIVVFSISMVGCSATPLTQNQVQLTQAAYTAQGACYDRLAKQDLQINTMLSKVPDDQVGLVIALQSMQENNKSMMAMVTGNSYNPCDMGDNAFTVQIAEINAKNKTARDVSGNVLDLGKWVAGAVTVLGVADKISGDTLTAHEGSELNQKSKNTSSTALGEGTSAPVSDNKSPGSVSDIVLPPEPAPVE